jgi:hypothetical protein
MPSAVMFDLLRISFSNQPIQVKSYLLGFLAISFIALFGVSRWLIQRVEG